MKCGEKVPEDAEFCPKCGGQITGLTEAKKQDYSGIGGTLVLIGGILAIIFSIFPLTFMLLWRGMMWGWMDMPHMWDKWGGDGWQQWGMPWMTGAWGFVMGFMIIGAIISIVMGIVAIYAYKRVRDGEIKNGGIIAIILGVIMLVTSNWLPGILILIGGILCYTSK